MNEQEKSEFLKILKKEREKFSQNSEEAKEFLVKVGISTTKGNFKKAYKYLCIPQEQA